MSQVLDFVPIWTLILGMARQNPTWGASENPW